MNTPVSITLNEDFHFNPKNKISLSDSQIALKMFTDNFEQAIKLEIDLPIVLDANILLGYYGMSQSGKSELIGFIDKYLPRLHITSQVESEYSRNRLGVIKTDFFDPLTNIVSQFKSMHSDIQGKLKSYSEKSKNILSNDFNPLWNELMKVVDSINKTLHDSKFPSQAEGQITNVIGSYRDIEYVDSLLEKISKIKLIGSLKEEERNFLKEKFAVLLTDYESASGNDKGRYVIPGCNEKGKDDGSGDFIIFNEILRFMKENKTSCIFLTNDVTKGDWLRKDKRAHIHYIEHAYKMTNQMLYIIHAEKALSKISFSNIYVELEIVKATYGTHDGVSYDVTQKVKEQTKGNKLTIKSSNAIAGDPKPGTLKQLDIEYKLRGVSYNASVLEGDSITIG